MTRRPAYTPGPGKGKQEGEKSAARVPPLSGDAGRLFPRCFHRPAYFPPNVMSCFLACLRSMSSTLLSKLSLPVPFFFSSAAM